ncbi:MAG: cytochrome C oxidase subunit IV family protein [Candidatus Acidiferrales bacterium]
MPGHVVPVRVYVMVFLALLFLTGLTTGVAFVDLGAMNTVAALAIAVVKMLLVALFFMELRYSPGLTRVVVVTAFFFLALLISLTLADNFTRPWTPTPSGWGDSAPTSQNR